MVFEHRSSALVHRAPPLPILSPAPNGGSRLSVRRRPANNHNSALTGQSPKLSCSAEHFSPAAYSSGYANAFVHHQPYISPSRRQQQQQASPKHQPNGKLHLAAAAAVAANQNSAISSGGQVGAATFSRRALSVDEYERELRQSASELELLERVFRTGTNSNQLRASLWPYLFGLVKQRGRFVRCSKLSAGATTLAGNNNGSPTNSLTDGEFVYVEHEDNVRRWRELERLYRTYENQWKSIQPEQELRFSQFRERKSLIERDVVRSDRSHPFYSASQVGNNYAQNLTNLTRVLMSYMMYDFDIGYLQGMSDLAAPILFVFQGDVVKTFWVFVEVMKLFRRNFEFSQKTIHFQLNCLFRLIKLTDSKLANYLRETDCSNCFFVFRHVVCQFKRELMRASSGSSAQSSSPSSPAADAGSCSSTSGNDSAAEESADSSSAAAAAVAPTTATSASISTLHKRDDYDNVLNLWDTIWFVQRRHELRAKSRCVHTYKIATKSKHRSNTQSAQQNGCCKHRQQANHCNHNNNNNNNNNNNIGTTNQSNSKQAYQQKGSSTQQRHQQSSEAPNCGQRRSSSSSLTSTGSSVCSDASASSCCSACQRLDPSTAASATTASATATRDAEQVKQEQIVYTKETFYSSFDPNQADIPRVELTETEKFVISLCLSLIRRERNYILQNRLDASEIHQHFIRPRLASDLGEFLGQAYEIYHILNHECDLPALVKGASEFADPSELSPVVCARGKLPSRLLAHCTPPDEQLASSSAADTYDLLKDYFIISPTAYDISIGGSLQQAHEPQLLQTPSPAIQHQQLAPPQSPPKRTRDPSRRTTPTPGGHQRLVSSTPIGMLGCRGAQKSTAT